MIARSESWSLRADGRHALAAAVAGAALFAAAWALLHVGFYDDSPISDTPVYRAYGEQLLEGKLPYRDFDLEYPPGALPAFALPAFGAGADYEALFEAAMLVCGAVAVALLALALAALGVSPGRLYGAVALAALAPLLLGPVILTRYDLWPAALCAAALAALLWGRERLGFAALGLGVAAKLYPLALVPVALVFVVRRRGGREAANALGVFGLVVAAVFLPFALVAPSGVAESFERQFERPLQIESLGAALLLAGRQLGIYDPTIVSSHGSQNLAGSLPDGLATAQTVLQALAVAGVWLAFARGRAGPVELVAASAAAVAAAVAFGKVVSPQFLIWLVPLVPFVVGAARVRPATLVAIVFAASLVLTQLWFPSRYWDVVALEPVGWLVLLRDVALVALFAVLAFAIRRRRARARSA